MNRHFTVLKLAYLFHGKDLRFTCVVAQNSTIADAKLSQLLLTRKQMGKTCSEKAFGKSISFSFLYIIDLITFMIITEGCIVSLNLKKPEIKERHIRASGGQHSG